jgi:hypothetical protein
MKTWWITMGDFSDHTARVVELTRASGVFSTRQVLEHTPPPSRRVLGKGFTGAVRRDDTVWVCDFNAIYKLSISTGALTLWASCGGFNDLHHVAIDGDHVFIANTGHDRVEVFSTAGEFLGGYALAIAEEEREPPSNDPYFERDDANLPLHQRILADRVHPNHVCARGGRLLVTCFAERRVRDLAMWEDVIPDTHGHPHDGVFAGDHFWITTTDGVVSVWEPSARGPFKEVHRVDTFARAGVSGWCRGLWVGEELMLVGLTRISRMPGYRWCDRPFESTRTAILALDRMSGEPLDVIDLESFGAHPKLFSILEVS